MPRTRKADMAAPVMDSTLGQKLGEYACAISFDNMSDFAVAKTKACLLDSIATGMAGRNLACSRIAVESIGASIGSSTIIGKEQRVSAMDAAFVNGVMMHSVLYEDYWQTGSGHQGVQDLPTALAVGEEVFASGREVICAIAAGYELYGMVYLGVSGLREGFRTAPVMGAFGSATTAGKLVGLDAVEMATALEYAANFSGGLAECWLGGTMEGMFHAGIAARNGVLSATLARAGADAAPGTFEGEKGFYRAFSNEEWNPRGVFSRKGKDLIITEIQRKIYPACGNSQVAMDLALSLKDRHKIDASQIKKVVATTSMKIKTMPGQDFAGPFESRFQAGLSLQFSVASALLGKPIDMPSHFIEDHADPAIAALAAKIDFVGETGRTVPKIEVFMKDGKKFSLEEDRKAKFVLTLDTATKKFRRLAADDMSAAGIERVIGLINNLEKLKNIRELTENIARLAR